MNQVVPDLEQDALVVEQAELPTSEQVEDLASTKQPPEGGEASMTIEPTSQTTDEESDSPIVTRPPTSENSSVRIRRSTQKKHPSFKLHSTFSIRV